MNSITPLLFALIAAVGNAMFAAGQKKAINIESPFSFIVLASSVCLLMAFIAAPMFGAPRYELTMRTNFGWAILSGVGLFLTYLGFNLLYSNYGTSSYILYAVVSIITTALLVGVFIFKETFNLYHWASMFCAIVAISLYVAGNKA